MTVIFAEPAPELAAGLEGHRALVLGASHGVGPAVVAALREAGTRLAADVAGEGVTLVDEADPVRRIEAASDALGGLDILVLSAPPVRNKPVLDMTPEEMRGVAEIELVIPALQMQAAAR